MMFNQKYFLPLLILNIAAANRIKATETMTPKQQAVYARIMSEFHNLQLLTDQGASKSELDRQSRVVIDHMTAAKSQFTPSIEQYIDTHIGAIALEQKANYPTSQQKRDAQARGINLFSSTK